MLRFRKASYSEHDNVSLVPDDCIACCLTANFLRFTRSMSSPCMHGVFFVGRLLEEQGGLLKQQDV